MNDISAANLYPTQNVSPEVLKKVQSDESFGALDTEKIKQDTVEIAAKAKEQAKENFVFRIMRNLGVEEPKKLLVSLGCTAATMVGFAVLGNKMSSKFAKLGLKIDDTLQGDSFKWARNIGKKIKDTKNGVSGFLRKHSKSFDDIATTLKDPAKKLSAEQPWAKTQCSSVNFQAASAVVESMQGIFYGWQKNVANKHQSLVKAIDGQNFNFKYLNQLTKEIGTNFTSKSDLLSKFSSKTGVSQGVTDFLSAIDLSDAKVNDFLDEIFSNSQKDMKLLNKLLGDNTKAMEAYKGIVMDNLSDRVNFVNEFTKGIRKANGNLDNKGLLNLFEKLKDGSIDDRTKDILMCHGMDNWTFTNLIDKFGHKIRGDKWKNVSRANLGSALIKYNAVSGNLADSALGKVTQGFPTTFAESVSNHVFDMAAVNMMVVPSYISLFNNVQDAPKEQKGATLANSFLSDVGRLTIVTPLAGSITYGLASLKNLEGKGILSKCLKLVGKVVGLGLGNKNVIPATTGGKVLKKLKGIGGGAIRFGLIMFVLSGLLNKPLEKITTRIFGKPYDKAEVEKEKQLEEQKNQIIPELGITQGEFLEKMQKNPQALQKLQTDSKLAQLAQQNPKILLDLLDNKPIDMSAYKPAYDGNKIISPANANLLANGASAKRNLNVSSNVKTNTVNTKKEEQEKPVDTATYIPSSSFTIQTTMSPEQLSEYELAMNKADKALERAQKYI